MTQDSVVRQYQRRHPEVVEALESNKCEDCKALPGQRCRSKAGAIAFWHKSRRQASGWFDSLGNLRERRWKSMTTYAYKLNGTDENPFHRLKLKRNPFGQINKAELDRLEYYLMGLGAEPIKSEADLRGRLAAFERDDPKFIDYVVSCYKPGEMTEFEIEVDLNTCEITYLVDVEEEV